ncbi:MAG: hypothetical protein ACI8WB_003128 [Phenylobacterium sp.]|jgi:hypothetical protein
MLPLGDWLSVIFDIPEGAPIKEHKDFILITSIFMAGLGIFMCSGYLFGWFINVFVARFFYKWPNEKARRVFLFSDIPNSWLKVNVKKPPPKKVRERGKG